MDAYQLGYTLQPAAIVWLELDKDYCRDTMTVPANTAVAQGAVVGSADGQSAVPINFAATDGTQNAAGVAFAGCSAQPTAQDTAVFRRGPVGLRREMLVWPTGATAPQIAAALAQLLALGILTRPTG